MLETVWEMGTLLHCWWEYKLVQPLWKTVWRFLKKLKIELPYDPIIPFLGIYPNKITSRKDTWTPMFLAAWSAIAVKTTEVSIDRWIKMWDIHMYVCVYTCVYTYTTTDMMEYYSVIKKNEIMSFAATWMDSEIITWSEISQKEKDKYHMTLLTCRI